MALISLFPLFLLVSAAATNLPIFFTSSFPIFALFLLVPHRLHFFGHTLGDIWQER